jgi:hypothetical protein
MKRTYQVLILSTMGISILVVSAVCWHSVEEIHYLKSFYPHQFSVEEAFYASAVELIKVIIISFPFFFMVGIGICLLYYLRGES